MDTSDLIWFAADYHLSATYSCRTPLTSMSSALALPAPSPATVRLALIRTAIEVFGLEWVQHELFPIIRSAEVRIRPPERVAFSSQLLHAYKANKGDRYENDSLEESIVYREFAHATGALTVFLKIPSGSQEMFREILGAIGYWGRADSFTCCLQTYRSTPAEGDYAIPLRSVSQPFPLQHYYKSFVSEFGNDQVDWEEIMPDIHSTQARPIRIELYVWPLIISKRISSGELLVRQSLVLGRV